MACCILILLWVQDEMSFDNFHVNNKRLYRVTTTYNDNVWDKSPWALKSTLSTHYPEIEEACWYTTRSMNVRYEDKFTNVSVAMVSPEFFDIFTFPLVSGNPALALEDINSVIISEKTASIYFGNDDPLGKVVSFENRYNLTVTGVMKNIPGNSHIQFALAVRPDLFYGKARLESWVIDCSSYVLLHEQVDIGEIVNKISNSINENDKGTWDGKMYVALQPLRKIHTYALKGTDPVIYVRLFSLIAIIVLMISCINFINLSISQYVTRAKEVATRKVFGAERGDVIKQYLCESMMLSFIALAFSLLLVYLFLPSFNILSGKHLAVNLLGNLNLSLKIILIAVITGLISGLYPSLYFSTYQPIELSKGSIAKRGKGQLLRRVLIVFQFSSAIILLFSISVIGKQINFIRMSDLGFNRNNIITLKMDGEMLSKYDVIKGELLKYKKILNVAAASNLPLDTETSSGVYWEGLRPEEAVLMNFVCVDYDYFETFKMTMTQGRSFSRDFPTDGNSYIINETGARMIGSEDPIGKGLALTNYQLAPIIGVVKDFHGTSLHNDIKPTIFFLFGYAGKRNMFIRIDDKNIAETIENIKETVHKYSPDSYFGYRFIDEQFNEIYQQEAIIQQLIKYFTILAIFISCIGLLGLASFVASQRTKEFAVRKVMGANSIRIMVKFSKEFIILVFISNMIAWPIAFFLMKEWLETFVYRTNIGIFAFIFSGTVAFLITLVTIISNAYKVSRCNLAENLK